MNIKYENNYKLTKEKEADTLNYEQQEADTSKSVDLFF